MFKLFLFIPCHPLTWQVFFYRNGYFKMYTLKLPDWVSITQAQVISTAALLIYFDSLEAQPEGISTMDVSRHFNNDANHEDISMEDFSSAIAACFDINQDEKLQMKSWLFDDGKFLTAEEINMLEEAL